MFEKARVPFGGMGATEEAGDFLCVQLSVERSASLSQRLLGEGSSTVALLPGTVNYSMVAWLLGSLSGTIPGKQSSIPKLLMDELCLGQSEGDGVMASLQHNVLPRLKMVPFVEGEPLPLNWSQALVVDESGGSEEVAKEVEIIMVFSQIVGVSCDGHTDRLREAFALFWLARLIRRLRILLGEVRRAKKVRENLLISFHRLIMRGDVGVCLVAEEKEGGITLFYEVQHPFLECKG